MTAYCIASLKEDTDPKCTNIDAMASYLRRIQSVTEDETIKRHCTNALTHYYLVVENGEIGDWKTLD